MPEARNDPGNEVVANYIILRQRFPLSEILLTYGGNCGSVQWIPDQGAVHVS